MWKYVSRRIKDTFERGAGYFDARSAASASASVPRDAEPPRTAVPSRWLCERRCWGGHARGEDANHQSYFSYLNQSWLGVITWSSALCLGWYASQLIHLRKKCRERERGALCTLAAQLQGSLRAGQLFAPNTIRAISDDEDDGRRTNKSTDESYSPVQLVTNERSGSTSSAASSSDDELSNTLNSIENKLALAAIENGQHKDGLSMLRSAASRHHPPALYNLALCYELGLGVTADEHMAMELYRAAASQEHPGALYNLAVYYGQGRGGLTRDLNTANRLLRLAAHKGQEDAIEALKTMEPSEEPLSLDKWGSDESGWSYRPDSVSSHLSLYVEQIQAMHGERVNQNIVH